MLNREFIQNSPFQIRLANPLSDASGLRLTREWNGSLCRSELVNEGSKPITIGEIVLFEIAHDLPADTRIHGEGFTMLSQTGGTLGEPADIGGYTDRGHYRIPQPDDATTVYGMLRLSPPGRAGDTE